MSEGVSDEWPGSRSWEISPHYARVRLFHSGEIWSTLPAESMHWLGTEHESGTGLPPDSPPGSREYWLQK